MSRTTIDLNPELHRRARRLAAETRRSLTEVVEEALRLYLLRRSQRTRAAARVRLPVAGRGGLRPGIDLDRTSDLLDRLDDELPLDARR
jgi:predicted transcriptional regulator